MKIRPSEAKKFYEELQGKCGKGRTVSVEHIAETMEITTMKAMQYCFAMVYYGITEKQGEGYVI